MSVCSRVGVSRWDRLGASPWLGLWTESASRLVSEVMLRSFDLVVLVLLRSERGAGESS